MLRRLAVLLFCVSSLQAADKPNIILIYTDDHGWPDVGAVGVYPDLKTPNIDALASGGVRATSGYSTAPQCVPSRGGLLAGRAQNRFGLESNAESAEVFEGEFNIAERLKKAGYATGQIGKWHLGPVSEITKHGFDDVYAKNANRPGWANYDLEGNTVAEGLEKSKLYHLDACSEAARAFIERHEDEPFFLYLAYRAPHVPLDAPKKYLSRFPGKMPERRRQALAMISAMDDGVGLIMETLEKKKLAENTLIFFIADNGAPLKIHKLDAPGGGPGWDGSLNKPMNGEKGMLSEGGIRVPYVVSWKGRIPGGQVYDHPIYTLDVAATAVELAGLPIDDKLDGVNLVPFLSGAKKGAPHKQIMWRWIAQSAIREGKWKLLKGGNREYLYDLDADKGELNDLSKKYPNVAKRLRGDLEKWSMELYPPGLVAGNMSQTWEDYFDFYMDGKEPAPLRQKFVPKAPGDLKGWVVRNAKTEKSENGLAINPSGKKQKPFMARTKIKIEPPSTVEVELISQQGGNLGISWRLEGQKDFLDDQKKTIKITGSPKLKKWSIPLEVDKNVIHLRVLLPDGRTVVKGVRVKASKNLRWEF